MRRAALALVLWMGTACAATPRIASLDLGGWHEIRTPLFSVVTHAPRAEALHQVQHLLAFTEVLRETLRVARLEPALPLRIYIFRGWDQYGNFAPRNAVGYMLPQLGRSSLVLSLQQPSLSTTILFHEYVHYLLRNRSGLAYPTWYDEGLAELLGATLIRGDTAWVGAPASRVRHLDSGRTTSLEVLLGSGKSGLDAEAVNHFYADSWLLVHYLHTSRALGGPERLEPMLRYLHELNRGIPWRGAFDASFGIELEELEAELDAHAERIRQDVEARKGVVALRVVLDDPRPELEVRDLPAGEAAAMLGELALGVGNLRLAASLAGEALRSQPGQVRSQALAAEVAAVQGDVREALAHAERAVALMPDDARAHESLGFVWAQRARREPASAAESLERARSGYTRAAELAPEIPSFWAGLGRTYLEERDCAALQLGIAALERARALAPWDAELNLHLGQVQARAGDRESARGRLEFVTTLSHSPEEVRRAEELLAGLDSAGPAACSSEPRG